MKILESDFWEFILKRHMIYRRRFELHLPKPWTEDPILQHYRFCNVFRELDMTTKWIRSHWREPYMCHPNLSFAMSVARQINHVSTLEAIGFPEQWNPKRVMKRMQKRKDAGLQVYTGAYMLTGTLGGGKIEQTVMKILDPLFKLNLNLNCATLEEANSRLRMQAGFGGFMAYEVITDLRHTPVLWSATDTMTWCHLGPGAVRGIKRLFPNVQRSEYLPRTQTLLSESTRLPSWVPKLEMRDIEHCLCEFDKYMRVKLDEGRPRSRYNGI